MNIIYYADVNLSKQSAERTHVGEVINNMAKLGHKVHLLAIDKGDYKLHKNVIFHKLFRFKEKPGFHLLNGCILTACIRYKLNQLFSKKKIDLVYQRGYEGLAINIAHNYNIPSILELNGVSHDQAKLHGGDNKSVNKVKENELNTISLATHVISVTPDIKDLFVSLGIPEDKISFIPNGANTKLFKPENRDKCRKKLGLENHPTILFSGSFRIWQGLEYLIKSFSLVVKEIPNARLIIVGDNTGNQTKFKFRPSMKELQELAKKKGIGGNVIFTGRGPYEKIPIYINASDVCINFRDSQKGFFWPLKLFEYMACGKPVISTKWKTFDFIEKEKVGILVNHRDLNEVSKNMVRLLRNPSLAMEIGRNGRRLVVENYSWKSITKWFLEQREKPN